MSNLYNICVIDDEVKCKINDVEFNDTKMLNHSLLEKISYDETKPLDAMMQGFFKSGNCNVSAFKNPQFFHNHKKDHQYFPDIIILDWNFAGAMPEESTDNYLKKILDESYALVYIYSDEDNKEGIELLLNTDFNRVKDKRVFLLSKNHSAKELINHLNTLKDNNFSMKFGNMLRKNTASATEKILTELSEITNDEIDDFILENETPKDLIDFITEKFRNYLSALYEHIPDSVSVEETEENVDKIDQNLIDTIKKIWSKRLYFRFPASDPYVRKGDILKIDNKFYLVVQSDCDLARFVNKTNNYLLTIPIERIDRTNLETVSSNLGFLDVSKLKKILANFNSKTGGSLTSVLNKTSGFFMLPFVEYEDGYSFFIGSSKRINTIKLTKNNTDPSALLYTDILNSLRISSVVEPFLEALLISIRRELFNKGVPDYHKKTGKIIEQELIV
ncbi:MAG: response regulator receiver domain [Endomicrobiaceae bacterium]